jgi:hypothetical protein
VEDRLVRRSQAELRKAPVTPGAGHLIQRDGVGRLESHRGGEVIKSKIANAETQIGVGHLTVAFRGFLTFEGRERLRQPLIARLDETRRKGTLPHLPNVVLEGNGTGNGGVPLVGSTRAGDAAGEQASEEAQRKRESQAVAWPLKHNAESLEGIDRRRTFTASWTAGFVA